MQSAAMGSTLRMRCEAIAAVVGWLQMALSGWALLLRLNPSKGFIGCQLRLFQLTVIEIPNLGLQRRFGNRAHLENQSNGVLGWLAGRLGPNQCGSGQVCSVKVCGEGTTRTDWSARVNVSLCQITAGPLSKSLLGKSKVFPIRCLD
jgi:hypothetical protein